MSNLVRCLQMPSLAPPFETSIGNAEAVCGRPAT